MSKYEQLKTEIAKLEKEADALLKQEMDKALDQVRILVKRYGLTADQIGLAKGGSTRKKAKAPAKYRDPATGYEWNGIGKRPKWIVEAGVDVDKLLIANQIAAAASVPPPAKPAAAEKAPAARSKPAKTAPAKKTAAAKKAAKA